MEGTLSTQITLRSTPLDEVKSSDFYPDDIHLLVYSVVYLQRNAWQMVPALSAKRSSINDEWQNTSTFLSLFIEHDHIKYNDCTI